MAIIKKSPVKKAQSGIKATKATKDSTDYYREKAYVSKLKGLTSYTKPAMDMYLKESDQATKDKNRQKHKGKPGYDANGYPKKKAGGMIKRSDGSMSKRGLWDNIRANKGSGKKPTAAMLKQEKKIKAKAKK